MSEHATPEAPLTLLAARLFLLAAFVVILRQLWIELAAQLLLESGFFASYYGTEFVSLILDHTAGPERQLAVTRMSVWAICVAFPFWTVSIALILRLVPGFSLVSLGLTSQRVAHDLWIGLCGWVVLTPLTMGVNWAVISLYKAGGAEGVTEHPLTRIAQTEMLPSEWIPFILAATVAAAVYEELLFRGILQSLCVQYAWGGVAAMVVATFLMLAMRFDRIAAAIREGSGDLMMELTPLWFALLTIPGFLAVWRYGKAPRAAGVYGTALLFASIHASVWPSPIGLFVLALGLGYLADRTGSLVGPIVVHSMFNGVNCGWLLLKWLGYFE